MNTRRLFTLMVIFSLFWPKLLTSGPVQARPASELQPPALAEEGRNSRELMGTQSSPPLRPVSLSPSFQGDPITPTQTFTFTEHFTTRTYQDPDQTTAEWNTSEGVLRLPELGNASAQEAPAIAVDAAGNTYVAWLDYRHSGGDNAFDIYTQKFDPNGEPVWPADVRVNSGGSVDSDGLDIILDTIIAADGNLVTVWESGATNALHKIYAQKLDQNDGAKLWLSNEGVPENRRVDNESFSNQPERPVVALDPTNGDIVVVWQDARPVNYDIYAQRLKADGFPRREGPWQNDLRVNTDIGTASQTSPDVGVDRNGYAYIVWKDSRNGKDDIYAQKIDPGGVQRWLNDFPVGGGDRPYDQGFPVIATSVEGESVVVWDESTDTGYRAGSYAQRISPNPQRLCPEDKRLPLYTIYAGAPVIALNSDSSAFITWSYRPSAFADNDLYLTKLDPDCSLWENEVQITFSSAMEYSPAIVVHAGNSIHIAWRDTRNSAHNIDDIYMQKFNADGSRVWHKDRRANGDVGAFTNAPVSVVDAAGNSRVVWWDGRNDLDSLSIYAQQLNPDGNPGWSQNVRVNRTDTNIPAPGPSVASIAQNVSGVTAVAWSDKNQDIYIRIFGSDGAPLWQDDVLMGGSLNSVLREPAVTMDPQGNVYVVWQDYRRNSTYPDIFIQKVDPAGHKVWGDGYRVHWDDTLTNNRHYPAIAFDDQNNVLFVVWSMNSVIYAQKLNPLTGERLWAQDRNVSPDHWGNEPAVATADGYAYVAWGATYVQKLDANGSPVWSNDVRIGQGGEKPAIAARANNGNSSIYVTWRLFDYGTKRWAILAQSLHPGDGHELWSNDIRVNGDDGWSFHGDPTIGLDANGSAYVVWGDRRQGRPDIYAQKILPDGSKAWGSDIQINPHHVYPTEAEARSLEVDVTSGPIYSAVLTVSSTLPVSATTYYLSNDGGQTWARVIPDIRYFFTPTTNNNDLRWLAVLTTNSDQTRTPVIDWLQIKYSTDPRPPNSVQVQNDTEQPLPGARVYHNGQFAGLTDNLGVHIISPTLQPGDTLAALQQVYERPTYRAAHNPGGGPDFAFRVYRTSLPITGDGQVGGYTVPGPDQQHLLTIRPTQTLVLFNLVVSIEWDANAEYIAQIEQAVRSASDYLYDYTDGQMALGWVTLYDNGHNWADADIQISTQNIVRPHAYIGGLISNDKSHVIRIGRFWDGNSGNQGAWDQPEGYRTLAHEFGHYALHLYDEYFGYTFDNGHLTGEVPAICTGPENRNPASDATNASVMDFQYTTTELSARNIPGLWSSLCEQTAQWQLNHESPWETLIRKYADTANPPRWQLSSPLSRGSVMAGPATLPDTILALPTVTISSSGNLPSPRLLTVIYQGQPFEGAIVALYKQNGRVIGQGFTNSNGLLEIYGAETGDIVRVASFDGGVAGRVTVGAETNLSVTLAAVGGVAAQVTGGIPHLQVRANPSPDPSQIDLLVSLQNFGPNADLSLTVTEPDDGPGHSPPVVPYNPITGAYEVQFSFSAAQQGLGRIRAAADTGFHMIHLQSTYRLQRLINDQGGNINSNDGNLTLHLKEGSLPGNEAYFVVMPPGAIPGPLREGLRLVGNPYDITASGSLITFERSAVLTLRYDGMLVNPDSLPAGLGIYRWEPNSQTWQPVPGSLDAEHGAVIAPVTSLGTYALLAPAPKIFLPIIIK